MKNKILFLFLTILFIQACIKPIPKKQTIDSFGTMRIELTFVDNIQYPGQTIAISHNTFYLDTLNSNYMRVVLLDSSVMKNVYHRTLKCCDTSIHNVDTVKDFFVKVSIITADYSIKYIMKKREVYDYFRTLFCICRKEHQLTELVYNTNLSMLRDILSGINTNYLHQRAFDRDAFGLDTFCYTK